jgi:2-haloacid dehalogenase
VDTSRVLAFDVNETLLDLRALDASFVEAFGDAAQRQVWFQAMLQLSFVGGLTRNYVDFTTAQRAALSMVSKRAGLELSDAQTEAIVGGMQRLPPHPDVPTGLQRLKQAGFRQVSLTNSPLDVVHAQLQFAGLSDFFEEVISADEVKQLKPAARPYEFAAGRCRVPIGSVRLIAAHAWDVSGALSAGAKAAFVARAGAVPSPIGPQPEIVAPDISALADILLA